MKIVELPELQCRPIGLYDLKLQFCSIRVRDPATKHVPHISRAVDILKECPWDPDLRRICILYARYSYGLVANIQIHYLDGRTEGTDVEVEKIEQEIHSLDDPLPGEVLFANEWDLSRKSNWGFIHFLGDGSSYFEQLAEKIVLAPARLAEIVRFCAPDK